MLYVICFIVYLNNDVLVFVVEDFVAGNLCLFRIGIFVNILLGNKEVDLLLFLDVKLIVDNLGRILVRFI